MTREEQRRKLAERMFAAFEDSRPGPIAIHWMLAALDAIGGGGDCEVRETLADRHARTFGARLIALDGFAAWRCGGFRSATYPRWVYYITHQEDRPAGDNSASAGTSAGDRCDADR